MAKSLPILNDMLVLFEEKLWPLLRDTIIPLWVDFVEKRLTLIKTVYDTAVGPALDLLTKALEISLVGAIETSRVRYSRHDYGHNEIRCSYFRD